MAGGLVILKLKRTPGIYLVGFMGSGKSTLGQMLADELGWHFVDLDTDIEAREQCSISDIFETRGEEAFREIETAVISHWVHKVQRGRPTVLALGGGSFVRDPNYELLEENGITVWLDCPLTVVEQRVARNSARPLARDSERMRTLYHARLGAYGRADFRVDASGELADTLTLLLALPIY
jgi:shikimate kinase